MQFTRLRLNGFKSFVDPTELLIREGLTGIVGPNGCGKSNLLEALRWVMGENRPKAMRGAGMEDVIFAGSATRPPRNFAEVALTIDNSDRTAPAAFNDSDTLEVVRRITRDAGSAYKVNGKDVRARDVQMLFADASTGAHSPALVRQGQIAELINAKPAARRRILEEAAGIAGLYQRRHEAELRLNATEGNLERIEDVLEQLKGQLAALARQARQAARYREIGAKLRKAEALLLYRRWQAAGEAAAAADAELRARTGEVARLSAEASEAMRMHGDAEAALPPLREERAIAAALVQRLALERDRLRAEAERVRDEIDRTRRTIAQLGEDMAREEALAKDAAGTISRLEWEAREIEKAAEGADERIAAASAAAREAAERLKEGEAALDALSEDLARLTARHQSAERLVNDAARMAERNAREAEKAQAEAEKARARETAAEAAMAEAARQLADAEAATRAAEDTHLEIEARRAALQEREAEARAHLSQMEGEEGALQAEFDALRRLVEREASETDALLDRLRVAPGWEAAVGAALGDDLQAPELEGEAAEAEESGWVALEDDLAPPSWPAGVTPLAAHVDAPPVLARRLARIGVVERVEDGARLQPLLGPGERLVSREGDLWRWDGYRIAAGDAAGSAALRLRQLNRLEALRHELEEARARAEGARQAHALLRRQLAEVAGEEKAAREARRTADRALAEASRALSKAEAERNIASGQREQLELAARRHAEEAAAARVRLEEARAALAALEDPAALRMALEEKRTAVEDMRREMLQRRSEESALLREVEARTRRRQEITRELSGWRHRQETAGERIAALETRLGEARETLDALEARPEAIAADIARLDAELETAEARKAAAGVALGKGEAALQEAAHRLRQAEAALGAAREARAGAEARAEGAREALREAAAMLEEETGHRPESLLEALEVTPEEVPPLERLEVEIATLRRQRDAMGAVNLRAEEDAAGIREEFETLEREKTDLEAAVARLRLGIQSLNREGRERLLTAFEEVNRNFATLFTHLFGGGEARLVMVESDDPLSAGLEIMCQPPGKKLSTLSLLSGGEQTLTALALIFAVFLANPAPICVLDEVDAPLDDANVTRFCDLLDEMIRRTETRFLIITHHAITMSRMDRLFGVTMAEQGVSQLVSVDLEGAERLVA